MRNPEKVRTRYERQLKKVKGMLEEFLQPWVIMCIEPGEVLSLGWTLLGESNKEVEKLEVYWDEWLDIEEGAI